MQTERIGSRSAVDAHPQDAADNLVSSSGMLHDDLQAVDRFLPDYDWFEQYDDRQDARRFAFEIGSGRRVELKF